MIMVLGIGISVIILMIMVFIPIYVENYGKRNFHKQTIEKIEVTPPFKARDYKKMVLVAQAYEYFIVVLLIAMGLTGIIYNVTEGGGGLYRIDIANSIVSIIDWAFYIFYILICFDIIINFIDWKRVGTNIFNDLSLDYEQFYQENNIPMEGTCKICGRPIPKYYGLNKNIKSETLNRAGVCFQADGQHIVYLQQKEDPIIFREAQRIYKEMDNAWGFWFKNRNILMIVAIVISVIVLETIAPFIYGTVIHTEPAPLFFAPLVYGLATFSVIFFWIPFFSIIQWEKKSHLVRRLYFDFLIPPVEEALEEGKKLDEDYGYPPDYHTHGDMPGFIETLKMARKMAKDIKGAASGQDVAKHMKGLEKTHKKVSEKAEESQIKQEEYLLNKKNIEERRKYLQQIISIKELLDMEALTTEEFEEKKNKYLKQFVEVA